MKKGKGGPMGGLQQLMRQANQMQSKMKQVQDELAECEFEGTSGGGAVTVKCNGDSVLTAVKISEDTL